MLHASPSRVKPVPTVHQTQMQPVISQQTVSVTLNNLRTSEDSRRRAVAYYVELERESTIGNQSTGELKNVITKRCIKSGRDRTGVDESCCTYFK